MRSWQALSGVGPDEWRRRGVRWRRHPSPIIAAALLLALATAPASAANREHQQLMADIRMLQEQNQQLQLTLANLTKTLEAVNTRLDQQAESDRKVAADQKIVTDALARDLRVVREKIDDTNVRLSSLGQEVEALRNSIPVMPLQPAPATEPGAALGPGETGETPPGPTMPAAPNPAAGLSPQRLYNQAYADFASGQWSIAIQGFQMFINTFPKSEQAATAQRNIGDAYSLDGKFDQAIAAYDKVISDYPTSPEVPMAYYKRGLAQVTLGQTDRARDSWDVVMKKYPDSEAAILAKQGLGRLKR